MCAMKAGVSRKTAGKYLRQDNAMEQRRVPHTWRTREDPLEGLWPKALGMLRDAPELEAKALFEHLLAGSPGTVSEKHLRTFQRRVRRWRLAEGPEQEVFFTQDHKPGGVLAVDWTDMGGLGITIQGRALVHKLFHAVLPYSNWEWAVRAHSESTLSLRGGLKATLGRLGRVPRELLTDHSSTATHQLKRGLGTRVFNVEYLGICEHFGITPRTINVGRPQENGSANLRRAARLGEELAAMGETAVAELPDYREVMVSVRSDSTIRINKMVYSVPSRLIGVKLLARVDENHVVLLEGAQEVARLPLSRGDRGAVIDFRHLIGHLLRKPGAFAGYRWREELFPSLVYRAAYDHLARVSAEADRRYLEVLKLAAGEGQTVVENALEHLLSAPRPVITAREVKGMLDTWRDLEREWRERPPLEVCLSDYDALLAGGEEDEGDLLDGQDGEVAA